MGQLVAKYKEEYDNRPFVYDAKKKKRVQKRPKEGFIAKAVRDFYPDLKGAKSNEKKFTNALKLASRAYQTYQKPTEFTQAESKHRFRAAGAGRKSDAPDVRTALFEVKYLLTSL